MSTQPRAWAEALCQHIHPERATIEAQAHLLTAHAVGWVTAAERLGLEIREEEPEATRARVLDAILQRQTEHAHRSVAWREMGAEAMQHRAREREAVVAWLRGESLRQRDLGNTITADAMHRMAARIVGCEHLIGGTSR